jgi:hypothetical protein
LLQSVLVLAAGVEAYDDSIADGKDPDVARATPRHFTRNHAKRPVSTSVYAPGTINADFLIRIDSPLKPGASLIAQQLLRTSGGRAGNVAVMVRRLDMPARLFGFSPWCSSS